jgi:hypothetical protein
MKPKRIEKRLTLKKETITNLETTVMKDVKGGTALTNTGECCVAVTLIWPHSCYLVCPNPDPTAP